MNTLKNCARALNFFFSGTPSASYIYQRLSERAPHQAGARAFMKLLLGLGFLALTAPAIAGRTTATSTSMTPAIGVVASGYYGVASGRNFTVTATVAPVAAYVGGTFTFTTGGTNVAGCTAMPINSAGQATCTTNVVGPMAPMGPGFFAAYSGTATYAASSTGFTLSIGAPSSIGLTAAATVGVGIPEQLCATVNGGGTYPPVGNVGFMVNGGSVATVTLNSTAVSIKQACTSFTYATANTNNQVYAIYNNTNSNTASVMGTAQTVVSQVPTISLASASNPGGPNSPVSFLATTNMAGAAGCITLLEDGTAISPNTSVSATNPTTIPVTLTGGTHNISATYNNCGTTVYATSNTVAQLINLGTTANATSLTSSVNPSIETNPVSLSASVSPSSATGTVTFKAGSTPLGTSALTNGVAGLVTSSLAIGTHSVVAVYSGDNTYLSTSSTALNQQVNARANSALSLTVDIPFPVVHGTTQKFSATVLPASATGTVVYKDGATVLAAVPLSGGVATYTTNRLSTGTHSITASYSGDGAYAPSTAAGTNDVVTIASSEVALSGGAANANVGYCQVMAGNVSSSGTQASNATGTAQFFKDTTSIGSAPVSAGQFYLSCLSPTLGANNISVKYSGDANYTASTSPTVVITGVKKTVASMRLMRAGHDGNGDNNGNHFFVGDTHGIEIWASDSVGGDTRYAPADGTYTIKNGATTIGTATPVGQVMNGITFYKATIPTTATSFTTAGIHTLTVTYSGNATFASGTFTIPFLVTAVANTTLATSATPVGVSKPVILRATLSPVTGQVLSTLGSDISALLPVFKDGTKTIAGTPSLLSLTSSSAVWTLSYTPTTAGNKTINVSYPKNTGAFAATAPAFNLPVMAAGGSATVVSAAKSSLVGSPLAITATVTGNTATVPTGTVTFKDGTTAITGCSALALTNAVAVCTTSALVKGAHSITAVYSGNSTSATSTSAVFSIAVTGATTTTLTSSVNPVQSGMATMLRAEIAPATATGKVNFYNGSVFLGTATLASGVASVSVTFTEASAVTAVYEGDANNYASTSASLSQGITKYGPTVTATPSANPSGAGSGNVVFTFSNYFSTISYRITVNGATHKSGTIGTANQSGGPTNVTFDLSGYQPGSYSISGSLEVDPYNSGASATVAQVINAAVVLKAAPNPVAAGGTFVATATISGNAPSGTVTFKDGTANLGTGTISAGIATLSTSIAAAGKHTLTAVYSGDANNPASTSAPITIDVGADSGLVSPGDMTNLYEYDANGNRTKVTDPIGHVFQTHYDKLNRVATSILPAHAAGATPGIVTITMDAANNVKEVKDPRDVTTTYVADGLGQVKKVTSPDSGITNYTYHASGSVLTKTDARGMVSTMAYDEVNRLKSITYTSGVGTTFVYDGGASPVQTDIGHLTSVSDESGSAVFAYDPLGRILSNSVVINGKSFAVKYAYGTSGSAAGSLTSITYPSGSIVNYSYGADGQVSALNLTPVSANGVGVLGQSAIIMQDVVFHPVGGVAGWKWANGSANIKTFDSFGRLSKYFLGDPLGAGIAKGVRRTVKYDPAGKPVVFTHDDAAAGGMLELDHSYAYDGRSRVINATIAGTTRGYDYDASNNRTDLVTGGSDLIQTIAASSNRLTSTQTPGPVTRSINYDANGNIESDGIFSYTYSARGRMASAVTSAGAVTYRYNAFDQRVYKAGPTAVVPTGAAYFVYDVDGRILGEYDANGTPIYETVYLLNAPVALLKTAGSAGSGSLSVTVFNVFSDHLDTPRVAARATDNAIAWRWDSAEPFGATAPNQNPNALGVFVYNQRFPGQVFDGETGKFYNYFRDYDPQTGRYVQSDPIGLNGGINTYAYVGGDPLSYKDPLGLAGRKFTTQPVPVTPDLLAAASLLQRIADDAAANVDANCGIRCLMPWIRGILIHSEFERLIKAQCDPNMFKTEVSYLNGTRVNWGTPDSSRADVIYGHPDYPTAVFDLKTGWAFINQKQLDAYGRNLPPSPIIKVIRPTGG